MKLGEIIKIRGVLFRHKNEAAGQVPIKVKYKITKFLFETDQEAGFFDGANNDLKKLYCNDDGVVLDGMQDEYKTKFEELVNTEVDKVIEFTIDELEHFDLSVDDLICLYGCIKEVE